MLLTGWRLRIQHILGAIEQIGAFTQGMSFEEFARDAKTVYAVTYAFSIIGEAARNMQAAIVTAHPELPWSQMVRMRNVMVHAYHRIDTELVWRTAQLDLPPLTPLLKRMLQDEDAAPPDFQKR